MSKLDEITRYMEKSVEHQVIDTPLLARDIWVLIMLCLIIKDWVVISVIVILRLLYLSSGRWWPEEK